MQRALGVKAIDNAFIQQVDRIFMRMYADIKSGTDIDHARKQHMGDFDHAVTTHSEMMNHLKEITNLEGSH